MPFTAYGKKTDETTLLTLPSADEDGTDPRDVRHKKHAPQKVVQGDIFYGGRNFK